MNFLYLNTPFLSLCQDFLLFFLPFLLDEYLLYVIIEVIQLVHYKELFSQKGMMK